MATPTIQEIVAQIRTAIYGKDVRENIALGIEKTYRECVDISISMSQIGQTDDYKLVISN